MASAAARVEDLESGNLPAVCAKTGEPADGFARVEFTSTPAWTWILLLFGILPFLIARWFSKVRVSALVPMSEAALRRGRRFNWTVMGLLVVGALLLLLGFATGPFAAWLGLGALVAALFVVTIGWPFVWPTGHVEGEWVLISFVNRRFARRTRTLVRAARVLAARP